MSWLRQDCRLQMRSPWSSRWRCAVLLLIFHGWLGGVRGDEAILERRHPTTRFLNRLSHLKAEHHAMAWKEEDPIDTTVITYSVIVVERKHHTSNLFRDKRRVHTYSDSGNDSASRSSAEDGGGGERVVSVQFANPRPQTVWDDSVPPFFVGHPTSTDKKVRIVHISDFGGEDQALHDHQVSHLEAACSDPSETTIMVISDETCKRKTLPEGVPGSCRTNVVRVFPFNTPRPDDGSRAAYMPLGPRDTFPFVPQSWRRVASERSLFFNLQIRPDTSERRVELIEIAAGYSANHPDLKCSTNGETMSPEQWQELLIDSRFTISPAGRNPETFRTWEALEAGSIPIVSKLDFTHPANSSLSHHTCGVGKIAWNIVATSPFAREASVTTWEDLPALLDQLRGEPEEYINQLQADCMAWYRRVMEHSYASLLNFGQGHDIFPQEGPVRWE